MWKLFFDFCYFGSFFIPNRRRRENFRVNKLFDYRRKLQALRAVCSDIKIRHIKMIKGGWNIGFIINNKYVFKIRKKFDGADTSRIVKEKRMTDAFRDVVPLKIPKIDIISYGKYTFYRYEFISGHNLTAFSLRTILKHQKKWAKQLAEFIFAMHNTFPKEIEDLITPEGDSWGHNDICNNIIVNPKTMDIAGIIDWEYSGWNYLETEFENCIHFSKKMKQTNIKELIRQEYDKLKKKSAQISD